VQVPTSNQTEAQLGVKELDLAENDLQGATNEILHKRDMLLTTFQILD
jgi:hypothetical protein